MIAPQQFPELKDQKYDFQALLPRQPELLPEKNWAAVDLHVHTWCSYDVAPLPCNDPLVLYEKALQRGMRFVTFTDHDTMAAYDRIGWTRAHVVPGVEISLSDYRRVGHTIHINVYGLNKKQFLDLEEIAQKSCNIELLIRYLKDHDLFYMYNHPFWHELYEKPDLQTIFDIAGLFPMLEYNMGGVNRLNRHTVHLARKVGAGIGAGTDTHSGRIAEAFTLANAENFADFMAEVVAGRSMLAPRDLTVPFMTSEVLHRIHCSFNRKEWVFQKPSYLPDTGHVFFDQSVRSFVQSRSLWLKPLRFSAKKCMEWIARSHIPASLYVKSQELFAARISKSLTISTGSA